MPKMLAICQKRLAKSFFITRDRRMGQVTEWCVCSVQVSLYVQDYVCACSQLCGAFYVFTFFVLTLQVLCVLKHWCSKSAIYLSIWH